MSATVEDLAAAIGVEVEAIEDAVEGGDVDPLTDTARQKRQERKDRATAPELRSLAFCREEFKQLVAAVDGTAPDAEPSEGVDPIGGAQQIPPASPRATG